MLIELESKFHAYYNLTAERSHYTGSLRIEVFEFVIASSSDIAEVDTTNIQFSSIDEMSLGEKALAEIVVKLDVTEFEIAAVTLPECAGAVVVGIA